MEMYLSLFRYFFFVVPGSKLVPIFVNLYLLIKAISNVKAKKDEKENTRRNQNVYSVAVVRVASFCRNGAIKGLSRNGRNCKSVGPFKMA